MTSRLTVGCSNQLSYESNHFIILRTFYSEHSTPNILLRTFYSEHSTPNILLFPPAPALTEIRTRVSGFKVLSDNHYTIRAHTNILFYTHYTFYTYKHTFLHTHYTFYTIYKALHDEGFEPSQLTLPGLKSGSLDHSDIRAL